MTVIAAALAVALVAVVIVALRHIRSLEDRHIEERRELLNRIQAPERLPVPSVEKFEIPERDPDEWAQVGTITIDPDYGLDD